MPAGQTSSLYDPDALTAIRQQWTERHSEVLRQVEAAAEAGEDITEKDIVARLSDSEFHVGCIVNALVRLLCVRKWPDGRLTLDVGFDCPFVGEVS